MIVQVKVIYTTTAHNIAVIKKGEIKMDTIERLKKYMQEKDKTTFDISTEAKIREANIIRWLKGKNISEVYEKILKSFLTTCNY